MILLLTSSCLRLFRASSAERQTIVRLNRRPEDRDDLVADGHRNADEPDMRGYCFHCRRESASKLCHDKRRQLGIDASATGNDIIDGRSESTQDCFRRSTSTTMIGRTNGDRKWHTYRSSSFSESSATSRLSRNDSTSLTTSNIDELRQVDEDRQALGLKHAAGRRPNPPPPPPSWQTCMPPSATYRRHRQVSFCGSNGTGRPYAGNRIVVYSLDGGTCDKDPELVGRSREDNNPGDEDEIERRTTSPSKRSIERLSIIKLRTGECSDAAISECEAAEREARRSGEATERSDRDRKKDSDYMTAAECEAKRLRHGPMKTCWRSIVLSASKCWFDRTTVECIDDMLAVIGFTMFICYVIAVIVGVIGS